MNLEELKRQGKIRAITRKMEVLTKVIARATAKLERYKRRLRRHLADG